MLCKPFISTISVVEISIFVPESLRLSQHKHCRHCYRSHSPKKTPQQCTTQGENVLCSNDLIMNKILSRGKEGSNGMKLNPHFNTPKTET